MKKLFGGLNITWTRLVIAAVLAGAYTALMAMLPAAKDTSFADISITFEWWILFGILIITNSKTPLESALKCMVFFLISQPLVYLIQVPFTRMGWGLFRYYPTWFAWTMFTFPMGFIGWYMRKEKWWSILPLAAMLILLAYHFGTFLNEMRLDFPHHLLSLIFVAASMIIYPLFIFENKKLKIAGLTISIVAMLGLSVIILALCLLPGLTVHGSEMPRSLKNESSDDLLISAETAMGRLTLHGSRRSWRPKRP